MGDEKRLEPSGKRRISVHFSPDNLSKERAVDKIGPNGRKKETRE